MAQRAWLVDASIYIFRAWFSLPDRWHSPEGLPLNAVVGYSGFLLDLVETLGPGAHLAAAFDESLGTGFRHRIHPGYKASRALPDEALAFQLECCREATEVLGIACHGGPEYEADDYLASLCRASREADLAVTLVSRDKDLGQLLAAGDELWDPATGQRRDPARFREHFGVEPARFADFQALVGDRIDDIPGVPGVGPRTAAQLLAHFADLEQLGAGLGTVAELPLRGAASLARRLREHWPQVLLSRRLTGLAADIPGVGAAPRWRMDPVKLAALGDYLEALGAGVALPRRCRRLALAPAPKGEMV